MRQRVVDLTQGANQYDMTLGAILENLRVFFHYIDETYEILNRINMMAANQRLNNLEVFENCCEVLKDKILKLVSTVGNPIDKIDSLKMDTETLSHQLRGFYRRFDIFLDGTVRHLQQEQRVGIIELVILNLYSSIS